MELHLTCHTWFRFYGYNLPQNTSNQHICFWDHSIVVAFRMYLFYGCSVILLCYYGISISTQSLTYDFITNIMSFLKKMQYKINLVIIHLWQLCLTFMSMFVQHITPLLCGFDVRGCSTAWYKFHSCCCLYHGIVQRQL